MNFNLETLDQIYFGNKAMDYLIFAVIFILIVFFKHIISKAISKILFTSFKKAIGEDESKNFIKTIIVPIEKIIFIFGIYLAVKQLAFPLNVFIIDPSNKDTGYTIGNAVDKIFEFSIIVIFFSIALKIIDFVTLRLLNKAQNNEAKMAQQLIPFVKELVKIVTYIIAIFVILGIVFDVNIGLIVSGLGIGGLALAMAGKETLENLLGAFMIFTDKPFVLGDRVVCSGIDGIVEGVGFRSTRIRTMERSIVTVPNRLFVSEPLDNLSLKSHRKESIIVGLTYSTTPGQIRNIVADIETYFVEHPAVGADSVVGFSNFAESSLDISVMFFIEMMDYNKHVKIKEEVVFAIHEIVVKNKAEFAFPTRHVYHEIINQQNNAPVSIPVTGIIIDSPDKK